MLLEELFVDSDGLVEAAEVGKDGGQQTSMAGIARRLGEQLLDLLESGFRPAASIQQAGVVVARGIEARRELETAFEAFATRAAAASSNRGSCVAALM